VQFGSITYILNDIFLRFVVNIDDALYALLVDKMRRSHLTVVALPLEADLKLNVFSQRTNKNLSFSKISCIYEFIKIKIMRQFMSSSSETGVLLRSRKPKFSHSSTLPLTLAYLVIVMAGLGMLYLTVMQAGYV